MKAGTGRQDIIAGIAGPRNPVRTTGTVLAGIGADIACGTAKNHLRHGEEHRDRQHRLGEPQPSAGCSGRGRRTARCTVRSRSLPRRYLRSFLQNDTRPQGADRRRDLPSNGSAPMRNSCPWSEAWRDTLDDAEVLNDASGLQRDREGAAPVALMLSH